MSGEDVNVTFSGTHTEPNRDTVKRKVTGSFEMDFETGQLTLNVDTSNVTFADLHTALIECRDEFQRQINNRAKCPYYKADQ